MATMPETYERAIPGVKAVPWDPARFVPDAVLLLIGANDFANVFQPSNESFVAGYVKFLQQVRAFHSRVSPLKLISVCAASGTRRGNPVVCPLVQQAGDKFNALGLNATSHVVQLPTATWALLSNHSNYTTCLEHWNDDGHAIITEGALPGIAALLGWR